ncbi:MAG: hypothetical protein HY775_01430 [Acidobacteria bacterium]|nr:hypothetical protein [Acidobacteriota bacterium]
MRERALRFLRWLRSGPRVQRSQQAGLGRIARTQEHDGRKIRVIADRLGATRERMVGIDRTLHDHLWREDLRLRNDERALGGLRQEHRWLAGQVLRERYPKLVAPGARRSVINDHECRLYSQNGEDGILLYLFSKAGVTDGTFVEFGIEAGVDNSTNLAVNFGWRGLLMDCSSERVETARAFYAAALPGGSSSVRIVQTLVTPDNINDLLASNGFFGEIDLLTLDIDGNDYWVWKAITAIDPRVAVIEYNASFGAERSITTAYDPKFDRFEKHPSGFYHGASLRAMAALGNDKGYRLVGCDSQGLNAFFVRRDVALEIPEVSAEDAFFPIAMRSHLAVDDQFELVAGLEFVDVSVVPSRTAQDVGVQARGSGSGSVSRS